MANKTTLKLVIADDSDMIRKGLAEMIEEVNGVKVVGQANDGLEAIKMVNLYNPDVVILDLRMPRMNGLEALEILRKANPFLIIIVLTNYPNKYYRDKCKALGCDYFFDKSSDFEKVITTLKEIQRKRNNTTLTNLFIV
ncbi:MAG: hypothetical protein Kow0098_27860 [Ignavibacteriaceae bacterium]